MADVPLTLTMLLEHGLRVHGRSEVVTKTEDGVRRASYAEVGANAGRLANALRRLGVTGDERVATFMWNNQEHLEAYLAVPCMGAVLHTLNIRLFPDQLVYIANHAEDRVVIVDSSLVGVLAGVLPQMETVRDVLVVGDADDSSLRRDGGPRVHRYADLLAAESPDFDWVQPDERDAAAMCYTSGTTGNPKGVVYSHRSAWLHSLAMTAPAAAGLAADDRVLPVVPMFHANAWGLPYAAWMAGADLVMPDRWLAAEQLTRFMAEQGPTMAGGVPTVWNDVLLFADKNAVDLTSLRLVLCGGSAVPRALMERWQERLGVRIIQAWGMTETSPVAAVAHPPKEAPPEQEMDWRAMTGRLVCGVDARLVGPDGAVLPSDGEAVGELEVRGPWVTVGYYRDDDPAKFDEGWLRTGDVGTLDDRGFMLLTDRAKDVIKSGGEWISSVELENDLMGHPDVLEAAVVAVPDERWQERPLACVVPREGVTPDLASLRDHLAGQVARWQVPERWALIEAVPRTSVGKFDKKVLRARYAEGELDVQELDPPEKTPPV